MSNVNYGGRELLQIILSGQPQLKTLLSSAELVQFAQRISSDFHLGLLAPKEVPAYIDHRLAVAGATRQLFSDDVCKLIGSASKGTPRLSGTGIRNAAVGLAATAASREPSTTSCTSTPCRIGVVTLRYVFAPSCTPAVRTRLTPVVTPWNRLLAIR